MEIKKPRKSAAEKRNYSRTKKTLAKARRKARAEARAEAYARLSPVEKIEKAVKAPGASLRQITRLTAIVPIAA